MKTKKVKIGLVACSNGLRESQKTQMDELEKVLRNKGIECKRSSYMYAKTSAFSGTGKERAEALMKMYRDNEITQIFDVSGGDLANEILPYLDYDLISKSDKLFWGYSDLTTVINAIYAKTGKKSGLYQIRNLIKEDKENQQLRFGTKEMFEFQYEFIQGKQMEGVLVGGNIRCLLKLAGTKYWPDMTGKILFLEAMGGKTPQMAAYLNQLKQMGTLEQINGILLGTFLTMENEKCEPNISELIKRIVNSEVPIAKTEEIGHKCDSKAVKIGEYILLK